MVAAANISELTTEEIKNLIGLCGNWIQQPEIRQQIAALGIPINSPGRMTANDRSLLRQFCIATGTPWARERTSRYKGFDFHNDKKRAEESLYEFGQQAWDIVEPGQPFIKGRHIEMICLHLEALANGTLGRDNLLINIPPGHSKSIFTNVFLPAFVWAKDPTKRFLYGAYEQKLSTRDSIACRSIIESDWYKSRWPHVDLVGDQNEKTKFQNSEKGWRIASSVGGSGTGLHPHFIVCHPAGEPISTVGGSRPVESIRAGDLVWSYSHRAGRVERQKVSAVRRRKHHGRLITVRTAHGRIRVTADHPVYVKGRGYIAASEVKRGDLLLRRVPTAVSTKPGTSSSEEARILFSRVFRKGKQRRSEPQQNRSRSSRPRMRSLREKYNIVIGKEILLTQVPIDNQQGYQENVWAMRSGVQCGLSKTGGTVLLTTLCRPKSLGGYVGRRESEMARRGESEALQQELAGGPRVDYPAGRRAVRALRTREGSSRDRTRDRSGGSSYRLRQDERRPGEPHHALQAGAFQIGRGQGTPRAIEDVVLGVESEAFEGYVYNIEVENNHNYFTDELLVHNCDDPHDVRRANSEAERQKGVTWWTGTISSRGILVNVKKVVIMQRLHVDDVSGWILANQPDEYDHICLPARFEFGRMGPTSLGMSDWRSVEGELLWPSAFTEEKLRQMELPMGQIEAAGQLQQRPMIKGGMLFKREWFQEMRVEELVGGFTGQHSHFLTARGLFS